MTNEMNRRDFLKAAGLLGYGVAVGKLSYDIAGDLNKKKPTDNGQLDFDLKLETMGFGKDIFEVEFLERLKNVNYDTKERLLAQYLKIAEAERDELFFVRMRTGKDSPTPDLDQGGAIAYFRKIFTNPEYRQQVRRLISRFSDDYQIPKSVSESMFAVESNFDQGKVSAVGAKGIGQLTVDTAREVGLNVDKKKDIDERDDLEKNVEGSLKILSKYYEIFKDWHLALTAYVHGPMTLCRKLNSLYPNLTVGKFGFDDNGKKEFDKMLASGELNIVDFYLADPEFSRYAFQVKAMGPVAVKFLYDGQDHFPKVVPNEGYESEVAKAE